MPANGHDHRPSWSVEVSIVSARTGSCSAIGQILDHYRDYLLAIANDELSSELAPKIAPSDLVQETFWQATRDFPKFSGTTEAELRAWLRRMLIHNARDARRAYSRGLRDVSRETPFEDEDAGAGKGQEVLWPGLSPGGELAKEELTAALEQAIAAMSDDHRRVVTLRGFDRLGFAEIGRQMGRSADSVRKIWVRAIEQLATKLAEHDSRQRPVPR